MQSEYQTSNELKINTLQNEKNKSEATKIIDLNTDCMGTIFEHLELDELVNVADSSKHFYATACETYKRKYQNIIPIFYEKIWDRYKFYNIFKT